MDRGRLSRAARTAFVVFVAAAVLASGEPAAAEVLGGAADEVAAAPDQSGPDAGTPEELDGLQYADPTDGIGLIDTPDPDSFGEAQLRYPIDIPPGRLGWQPQVGLAYGSSGDNGWMGVGWDLSLDAIRVPGLAADVSADSIEVDTRWGVPRYDGHKETESYLFGGEQLSPNAHRSPLLDRNTGADDRKVFVKRVEADFLLIIRHGTSPRDYWWEVHDKLGNKYFYGGAIDERFTREDDGGLNDGAEEGHQVPEAVLTDDQGNAYWWGLREKWDISSNVVTYFYDKSKDDSGVGDGTQGPKGTQMYLDRINYSGSKLRFDATYGLTDDDDQPKPQNPLPRWGRYDVSFVRDADLGEPRRPDVTIDAGNGTLEVTAQLLRRVEVSYCPNPRGVPAVTDTTYPGYQECPKRQLVRRYHLNYESGPFAKTLLTSIAQSDADGNVFATHDLEYYDDVRQGASYRGFDASGPKGYETWATHLDNTNETILGEEFSSSLGAAKTTAGDGRLYLGFNPVSPDKNISIGGGIQLGGSDSEGTLELLDIDGDNLPDQVYKKGGDVYYRLNRSGPGGDPTFDTQERKAHGLGGLAENSVFSVGAGSEAYVAANIMYNHTWTFAREPAYFADVNADGRPDYVDNGSVLFNHRDRTTGAVSFLPHSAGTEVAIVPRGFTDGDDLVPDFSEVEREQRSQFPLHDTVRRWLAPFSGVVRVTAPVHVAAASPDGVRMAVQHNGMEVWHASVAGGDQAIRRPGGPDGLLVRVAKGDRIYFRVQSVDNGAGDLVAWDPLIEYADEPPRIDANGRDAHRYQASEDFTLAGRPGIYTVMPLDGRVRVAGVVRKTKRTTDAVRIVVEHNGSPAAVLPALAPDFVGETPVAVEFDVQGPRADGSKDTVLLKLGVDSHIDVTALSWTDAAGTAGPELYYLSASNTAGPVRTQDDEGKFLLQLEPLYDIDFYAGSNLTGPQGWTRAFPDDGDDVLRETREAELDVSVALAGDVPADVLPATLTFTMKKRDGLVHKATRTFVRPVVDPVPNDPQAYLWNADFDVEVTEDVRYWFDLTTSDPRLAPYITRFDVDVEPGGDDLPTAIRWPLVPVDEDEADVFPQAYRGWAYAGYNGDGDRAGRPLAEVNFLFDEDAYPGEGEEPTGFDPDLGDPPPGQTSDGAFKNPVHAKSHPYAPDPDRRRWRGPKEAAQPCGTEQPVCSFRVVGETFGAAGQASASRLGPDQVGAPRAGDLMPSGATAPVRLGEAEEDQLSVSLVVGGGFSTGTSLGILDFLDMNGDGYPDVVGDGRIIYTDQVGGRGGPQGVPGLGGAVRADHQHSLSFGGAGSPVSVKKSSSGDGNTPKQAGTGPKIGSHRKSSATKGSGPKNAFTQHVKSARSNASSATKQVKSTAAKASKSVANKATNAAKSASRAAAAKAGVAKAAGGKGTAVTKSAGKSGVKSAKATKAGKSGGKGSKSANKKGSGAKKNNQGSNKFTTARKAISKAAPSFDVGGSEIDTWTNTPGQLGDAQSPGETDLADLNGDGLPDRVDADGDEVRVWWNLGYRFTDEPVVWTRDEALEQGSSEGRNIDGGLGFNIGAYAFAGGVSVSEDEERTDITWADVNGDGLPDRLSRHSNDGGVKVAFNTGGGLFTPPGTDGVENFGPFMSDHVARTDNRGLGGGADLTIPIGPLCPPWVIRLCWIILNPGAHVDTSVTATRISLVDVNGDGYADSVSSDDDGSMNVRLNRTGRTNLLKSVRRPLGASFTLEYDRYGNTPDNPGSDWLLSKVRLHDGHVGDGVDVQTKAYRYEGGRFSYTEREGFGYRKVVESDLDQHGNVYRSYERVYDTAGYYSRGLLLSETVKVGGAPRLSTVNTYDLVDVRTGRTLDAAGLADTTGAAHPRLTRVGQRWHDTSGAVVKTTETAYEYDLRGNVTRIADLGEPGTAADDATAEMAYTVCGGARDDDPTGDFPWTQTAHRISVKSGDTWLQRREATMYCNYAAVTEVRDHLTPAGDDRETVAVTEVAYVDVGGQVAEVIGPGPRPDDTGDRRYAVSYEYDEVGAEPVRTSDSFGLATEATFDNRLGVPASVTDPNGARTSYRHDARGRLTEVRGPFQQSPASPPTIAFEYHAEAGTPWALTRHVDAARPGTTIDTVAFVDGLGRQVQTKRDATVSSGAAVPPEEVMVVSGRVTYDAFGREVEERHPATEPTGTPGRFNGTVDPVATRSAYDALDRITELVEPTDRTTTYDYGFEPASGTFGGMFTTTETDPLGSRTRRYTDVRDNVVGSEQLGRPSSPRTLRTRYFYDALQRLVRISDGGGHVTTAAYDLMGRRTSVDNPDTGRVELRYDLASNLVAEVTPKLRPAGKQITYEWDRNRLTRVRYPDQPANDVTYAYGPPGAAGSGAGRVVRVDDGARTQTRAYDLLGEVVEETTVMKVRNLSPTTAPAHTYTTRFTYDTWGRSLDMTYPDGEVLRYSYDSGGRPSAASGQKLGVAYPYVDRLEYDKFGNERVSAFANGVLTERTYQPDTLWLDRQLVTRDGAVVQDLRYAYDPLGNVVERKDSRPLPSAAEMGGPSTQSFAYDDLYRLTSASGTYQFPPGKVREYSSEVSYDAAGRVTSKKQTDRIDKKEQKATTYSLAYEYGAAQPHAPSRIGRQAHRWDLDGNLLGWTDDQTGEKRVVTWDEEDRTASVSDQGSTTSYLYTDEDVLAIERGPQSEVEFVNEFYTALSGGVKWKNVVVDDTLVATKRAYFDGSPEDLRYFLTSDLSESVNVVTDGIGKLFEHIEYFPSGEIWVREHSETFREPYLYGGTYFEEVRDLNRIGVRWYESQEAFVYSADPIIADDLDAVVDEPRLLHPFTYGFDNPVNYVDETGLDGTWVHAAPQEKSPGPLHSRIRGKVKAFVADPDLGERISGYADVPSLVEIDVSADGSFGIGATVLGFDVKKLKHLKKVRKLFRR